MKKRQKRTGEVATKAPKAPKLFSSQMPAVLYKKSYNKKADSWNILWTRLNFEKTTGFSYSSFKNDRKFWGSHLHPEDKKAVLEDFADLRKGKVDSIEITYRWLHEDGVYHWFNDHAVLVRDSAEKPSEIIGSWVDISVHAEAEEIIKENEEHYKKIVELSPHALFVHNDGSFRFLNAAAVRLFGGEKPEDIIGKPLLNFIHPDYHEQVRQQLNLFPEKKETTPLIDYKIVTLQGEVKKVEIAAAPFTFQGRPSVQGVIVDVTKLKLAEELYRTNADELEYLNKILMKRELQQSSRGEEIRAISFNEEKGFLLIGTTKVKIKKFSKQYGMLQVIFKDSDSREKDWQFSEISELMDMGEQFDWKKLYNIADAIKKNIAIDTGIRDFFILTTQSLKINPRYLKKS